MHMAMENGLPCVLACIYTDVKPSDRGVCHEDQSPLIFHQSLHGISFWLEEIEIVGDMSLWDHQRMQFGHGISVTECNCELVFPNQS